MSERSIFLAALDIANPAQRSAFLDQACGNEAALRKHIEELIAAEAKLGGFLARPHSAVDLTAAQGPVSERPGNQIGPYKLLEQIGEGGFGVVFMAEQQQPIRRKVALKILKPGMDTRQVIARFEAERQALALMDHPNIARVLDAGETSSGRPYFVMELVKGMPITQFCDESQLTTRERLELFVTVCQAAQHAHQKGIIHRDIKPTNVLVTLHDGTPVVKVIDFGVAKATGYQLTEKTLFTGFAQMIGTPLYMSPEQAALSGLDIDTRSDIYSLGVLLYELLTGTTPLHKEQLKQAAFDEVRRIIREEEAVKPSTRISTLGATATSISAMRKTEPQKLSQILRNELDWIVMKALEKDRTRRYETASAFAADVGRYLRDEQVEACPPSPGYKLRKYIRRNRGPMIAASLLFSALLLGMIGTTWGFIRARQQAQIAKSEAAEKEIARRQEAERAEGERVAKQQAQEQQARAEASEKLATERLALVEAEKKRAEEEKQISQSVRDFLQNKLLGQADAGNQAEALLRLGEPTGDIKQNPTIRELLDRAAVELAEEKIDTNFPNQPRLQAEILETVGSASQSIGEYQKAIALLQRSLALREGLLGVDHAETLTTRHKLGRVYLNAGKTSETIVLMEQVRDARARVLGPEHPDTLKTLNTLASAYRITGKLQQAIVLLEQVRDVAIRVLGPEHRDTFEPLTNLGATYLEVGRTAEAIALLEPLRDTSERVLESQHPNKLPILINLASAYQGIGKTAEAIALFEQVRDENVRVLGLDHPGTLLTRHNLANAYYSAGKIDEAVGMMEQIRDASERVLGSGHPSTLTARNNLATAYLKAGRKTEGLALLEQVLEAADRILGAEHPRSLTTRGSLASAYKAVGRTKEAIDLWEHVRDVRTRVLGPEHRDTLLVLINLATACEQAGRLTDALSLMLQARDANMRVLGPEHPHTLMALNNLAAHYWRSKQLDKSIPLFEQVIAIREKQLGRTHPDTLVTLGNLGVNYKDAGRLSDAIPLLEEAHKASRTIPALSSFQRQLLDAYGKAGKTSESIAVLEQIHEEKLKRLGPDHAETLVAISAVASAYVKAEKWTEAIPLYEQIRDTQLKLYGAGHKSTLGALTALAAMHLKAGKPTTAIPLLKQVRDKQLKLFGPDDQSTKGTAMVLALALLKAEAWTDAEPLLREILAIYQKSTPDNWDTFNAQSMLGEALLGQQKYDEAEPLLVAGCEGMLHRERLIPAPGKVRLKEALGCLVRLYAAWDKPTEAAKWQKALDDSHISKPPAVDAKRNP